MRFLEKLILVGFVFTGSKALAEDLPKQEFPSEIVYVPPGSTLSLGLKRNSVTGKAWLFPEAQYLSALQKAEQLRICDPALNKLRNDYSLLLTQSGLEASSCIKLTGEAHKRESDLTSRSILLESQNADLRAKLSGARKSAVVAWSVSGALLLGASTAVILTTH